MYTKNQHDLLLTLRNRGNLRIGLMPTANWIKSSGIKASTSNVNSAHLMQCAASFFESKTISPCSRYPVRSWTKMSSKNTTSVNTSAAIQQLLANSCQQKKKLVYFLYIFTNSTQHNSKEIIWPLLQVAWQGFKEKSAQTNWWAHLIFPSKSLTQ